MLAEGLFDRFPCDAVYGLHTRPDLPAGRFATRLGPAPAAADRFCARFLGISGHGGSTPHRAVDLTVVQTYFVLGLQEILGRNVPPVELAVLSIGAIAGGVLEAANVIPAETVLFGTARSFSPAVRDLLERRVGELAQGRAKLYGARAGVEYRRGTAATTNHPDQTRLAIQAAAGLVGEAAVDGAIAPVTGAEDFGLMREGRPGNFRFIGDDAGAGGTLSKLPTPEFDFNVSTLPRCVANWVSMVGREIGAGCQ